MEIGDPQNFYKFCEKNGIRFNRGQISDEWQAIIKMAEGHFNRASELGEKIAGYVLAHGQLLSALLTIAKGNKKVISVFVRYLLYLIEQQILNALALTGTAYESTLE